MSLVWRKATHRKWSAEKAARRIRSDVERPDFFSHMLKNNNGEKNNKEGMSEDEMGEAASILIIAGSENVSKAFLCFLIIHLVGHS